MLLRATVQAVRGVGGGARGAAVAATGVQRRAITGALYNMAKRVMPKISPTEDAALQAGTVGFDRNLFNGDASVAMLHDKYGDAVELTESELSFLQNEVEELCELVDDHQIMEDRDLPPEVWRFLKERGFFGLIIPPEYGGLGFSAHGHSLIVTKLASRSGSVAVTAMVPSSLGPAELLMRYGLQSQRDYFLPRLASGEMIPCFALTGPASGSDAASMRDHGVVCEEDGVLGIRASFNKRYITLAPVAGVVGLAINVSDPNNLLRGTGSAGITIALLERGHPGLRIGDRHNPLAAAFFNGTVCGDDVFIPMDAILGGQERVGFGWNMLMDCLAEGRAVSLPALSVAAAKGVASSVGAYARIRKQFKVPIADLEGVREPLARIGGHAMTMIAAQTMTNAMLNQHEQPAVISAIMKQQLTDRMRSVVNDGMDILGGAGICRGKGNVLASAYMTVPIAITVEGANALSRSLIIFGQGLTRSHPHLIDLIRSIQAGDDRAGFNAHLGALVKHAITSMGSAFAANFMPAPSARTDFVGHHEARLRRLTKNFAFCADAALSLGGRIKFLEYLSGRYADVLSNLYLGYAMLWYYKKHAHVKGLETVMEYALQRCEVDIENALHGIYRNFPNAFIGFGMRAVTAPFGRRYSEPDDNLVTEVAQLVSTDSEMHQLFASGLFISKDPQDRIRMLMDTLPKAVEADAILKKLRKEKRQATPEEQALIDETEAAREIIIQVDSFERLGAEIYAGADWTQDDRPALNTDGAAIAADQAKAA